jgi:DeoR/GlpR family transcriptional regulator of sugar metabolism
MMQRADRTVLLLDSSKFDLMHFERICALADIDTLVSEAAPPKKLAASLKGAGVQVSVAKA